MKVPLPAPVQIQVCALTRAWLQSSRSPSASASCYAMLYYPAIVAVLSWRPGKEGGAMVMMMLLGFGSTGGVASHNILAFNDNE